MNMIFIMSKTNQINIFSGTHYNTYVIDEKIIPAYYLCKYIIESQRFKYKKKSKSQKCKGENYIFVSY